MAYIPNMCDTECQCTHIFKCVTNLKSAQHKIAASHVMYRFNIDYMETPSYMELGQYNEFYQVSSNENVWVNFDILVDRYIHDILSYRQYLYISVISYSMPYSNANSPPLGPSVITAVVYQYPCDGTLILWPSNGMITDSRENTERLRG